MINISADILLSWWFKADMLQDGGLALASASSFSGVGSYRHRGVIDGEVY